MFGLFNALGTIMDVMSGFLCQPRFQAGNYKLNSPGDTIEHLQEIVMKDLDAIRAEACTRKTSDTMEQALQVFFVAEEWVDGSSTPKIALEGLKTALVRVGKAALNQPRRAA